MLDLLTIKKLAERAGFDLCGVVACHHMQEPEMRFSRWLSAGYASTLDYLERNAAKRFDPRLLVEGAKTAIVCAVGYKNAVSEGYPVGHSAKIASYATAVDYHTSIRQMLMELFEGLKFISPDLRGRAFVDSAPVSEKSLAVEAGLGWIGRQSLLVTPQFGSFVLLGELLVDESCNSYDRPLERDGCGACNRCVEACPVGAILPERLVDTRKCIACRTIEQNSTEGSFDGWIFGCDGCQSGCPYNQKAPQYRNPRFAPLFDPRAMTGNDWLRMTPEEFERHMGSTPLTRQGLEALQIKLKR